MAQVVLRPLKTLEPTFLRLLSPLISIKTSSKHHHHRCITFAAQPLLSRNVGFRSKPLSAYEEPLFSSDSEGNNNSESSSSEKSRNEKKREAKRAFQWGMEIARFSVPQIKLILRAASLEKEVLDAIMLVKKFGPDVREGKRRQFNYIGRLLRDVQPELMNTLLRATIDGDNTKLKALCGTETLVAEEDEEESENEEEEDEEGCQNYVGVATRWFEGLIDNNACITKEVYSIYGVEFDRQELRKLVRRVHSIKEQKLTTENGGASSSNLAAAEKSLIHFLRAIAKQMPTEKSRNEKKREAKRAFQWGMEIARFSVPQIKLILRAASLEKEVLDAIMLVKKFGPDVKEGKRRQFNYIGRLLRDVQPELMNTLLRATIDGDNTKLKALCGTETLVDEEDEEESENEEEEIEEEGCQNYVGVATRWFEGLIDNNADITKEVYSIYGVEFDRQELRKLVRRVHSIKEQKLTTENGGASSSNLAAAEKSLIHFLRAIAKQMPTESSIMKMDTSFYHNNLKRAWMAEGETRRGV